MGWTVRILGGPTPETWQVSPLPQDPALRDRAVRERAPGRSLQAVASGPGSVTYAPRGGAEPAPGPELSVVTERGPDGGRLAPLTGGGVSVGRGRARLLLDDPAAPSRPTRLRLAATGLHVEGAAEGAPRLWDGRRPHRIGRTTLGLARQNGKPNGAALSMSITLGIHAAYGTGVSSPAMVFDHRADRATMSIASQPVHHAEDLGTVADQHSAGRLFGTTAS